MPVEIRAVNNNHKFDILHIPKINLHLWRDESWNSHPGKCKSVNKGCHKFNGEKNENQSIDCG